MTRVALVYHKIEPKSDFGLASVTPERFSEHLHFLSQEGFEFTTISNLRCSSANKACAIVFDDAYQGVIDYAQPIMEAFDVRGTLAVIADYVGKSNTWDVPIGRRSNHCNWSDLAVLSGKGWEIASHSCTHRGMTRLTALEVSHECRRSKSMIEDNLGASVTHFVYPFGNRTRSTDRIVRKSGYRSMSGFFASSTPGWVCRVPVYRWDGQVAIGRKIRRQWGEFAKDAFIHFWSRATVISQPLWMSQYGID